MKVHTSGHRQSGAVIVTVALVLLFLLGFMGIALDFGRLFIVKTELQTALDSCALSAAQELDGASDALTRATSAGKTAADLNKINFQGQATGIAPAEVVFSDSLIGTYSHTFTPVANAKYVKCLHTKSGLAPWILQAMSAVNGDATYAASQSVAAVAVATRAPSQTNCLVPVGVCQKSTAPGWGFVRGEWIEGVTNSNDDVESGQFRWVDFTGSGGGAREVKDLLTSSGQCGLPGLATGVGKAGKTNGAVAAWNTRFGIYQGSLTAAAAVPDQTGYAWYADSAAVKKPGRYDDPGPNGFAAKRNAFAPYEGDNKNPDTLNLKTQGSFSSTDYTKGANRRVVTTAVVDCPAITLKGFACMLMLHPLEKNASGKQSKMWLEFIGSAEAAGSPCATAGLAGGTSGPKVPTLVQ
ncbi:hypothetical protein ABID97_001813 [Variovorax sp. OAS795]|uniref:pilus assembly protein TadG-related protein n=1 Tax=Variovorax sp. OAS795 TaxID=3034231 RepID=UPI0033934A3F